MDSIDWIEIEFGLPERLQAFEGRKRLEAAEELAASLLPGEK